MADQRFIEQSAPERRRALTWAGDAWQWALRTRTLRATRLTRGDWGYIAAVFALSRVLIIVVGLVGSAMFPSVGPNQTWTLHPITWQTLSRWPHLFDHFDSGWYISISHGYPALIPGNLEPLRTWGFLPGYPIALHIVAVTLSILHIPGPIDDIAGILISYAALFGGVVYLYRLTAAELDHAAARRAVTYLLVFPTSLFLSAVYPEGLFLLATVGAFYHARRRQWLSAGLLAAVAIVT
ncbi:MAG TPA: mannosyltransferase family protein, partial [Ktedonobacterales bacterium]